MTAARSVIIVGGGASGVLLALRLLEKPPGDVRVTLVERASTFGRGLAYGTNDELHRLNVVPVALSAFPDDPGHFLHWLQRTNRIGASDGSFTFVARYHFGDYLDAMLRQVGEAAHGRLTLVSAEAVDLIDTPAGVEVKLSSGASLFGHVAVLATGHDDDISADEAVGTIDPDAVTPILILGTGLSMIDRWLSLRQMGFRGRIVAMSRRGLLPHVHTGIAPMRLDAADLPFGTGMSYFMRWLREQAAETSAEQGDWRPAVDGIRPFSQRLWQSWSLDVRRRFLVHARAWWDIHRHRLAPEVHERLQGEVQRGSLQVVAAKPDAAVAEVGPQSVRYRRRGQTDSEEMNVAAVLDCRGLARDWEARPDSLIGRLVGKGRGRTDPMSIGLDVDDTGRVLDRDGAASPTLFAVGPLTRGTFFEIEAVPDIRQQTARLADLIADPALLP